jgi:hypothetical protein
MENERKNSMTIKELYEYAKNNGLENRVILLSEPENDASVLTEDDIKPAESIEEISVFEEIEVPLDNAVIIDNWKYHNPTID